MDITTATEIATTNKGAEGTVFLTDGTEVTGDIISVNSKGFNLRVDGKTRSFSLARITDIITDNDIDPEMDELDEEMAEDGYTFGADDDADDLAAAELADDEDDEDAADDQLEDIVNSISDGATTTEIAAHLSDYLNREITPKELRVHLRALGLGVGKGRKYALSSGEFRAVLEVVNAA
jgi:hypothetical protein